MSSRNRDTVLPIPNGWFAVSWSKDLAVGEVVPIRYFDEELVLFRGRSGTPRVLDAFCPHLGAHLGNGGRVYEDGIRCPFHGWRFDADGACVEIPYCDRIPPQARLRSWPVTERNQMILVWHHAEGKPPSWEPPDLPENTDPRWASPRYHDFQVPAPVQDLDENNCDPVHFQFVHGALEVPETDVSYAADGRILRMSSSSEHQTAKGPVRSTLERESYGLGLTSVRLRGVADAQLLLHASSTPVDAGTTHLRWLILTTEAFADLIGEEFVRGVVDGVKSDLPIWQNKIHRPEPVLCEKDTTLAAFRRWAVQFYCDPA